METAAHEFSSRSIGGESESELELDGVTLDFSVFELSITSHFRFGEASCSRSSVQTVPGRRPCSTHSRRRSTIISTVRRSPPVHVAEALMLFGARQFWGRGRS